MMSDQQLNDEHIIMVPWVPPKSDAWKEILRTVTIFQLLQAELSPFFEDKSLVIEGRGFATVKLVAHVISVTIQPAKAQYVLEDGTGRINADKDLDSLTQGRGLSAEAEGEEIARYQALEHTYVEVLGSPRKDNWYATRLSVKRIRPVHGYYQVMYHTLDVIHSNMLTQQHIQPYNFDSDLGSNEEIHIPVVHRAVDDDQVCQDDASVQDHITYAIPASPAILPNTFSPRKHRPCAALEPLERAIMNHIRHHKNHPVLLAEVAQVIQASCGCTELQFNVAAQALLSEARITSPLDDGYVVITPRH